MRRYTEEQGAVRTLTVPRSAQVADFGLSMKQLAGVKVTLIVLLNNDKVIF